jgi:hypothetical protein
MTMTDSASGHDGIPSLLLSDALREFTNQRQLAERAMRQVDDDQFFRALGDEENSIAIIAKHVGGNLRSRWTDFLTTDGEKPDRDRDGEFEMQAESRKAVMDVWTKGFSALENTLRALTPSDLRATVRIRGEELSAVRALNRSLAHTAQHVGQIILLAKHLRGPEWNTLSIPRTRKGHSSRH